MRDFMYIGPTPTVESCIPAGGDAHYQILECRQYIKALRRKLGSEPEGAELRIKREDGSDFGTYREVVCFFDDQDQATCDYALKCESDGPSEWTDEDRKELAEAGYPVDLLNQKGDAGDEI